VQAKKQIVVFILIIVFLLISANIIFQGCAGTSSKKPTLTPEREKAIQDSLYNVHKRKVALLYSFGFEPYKQGDFNKAKKYFIQISEMDTSDIYSNVLYKNLGRIFLQQNIPDSAEWAYKTDLEKNPNSIYSYKALGYLYRVQGLKPIKFLQRTNRILQGISVILVSYTF
jgi:tetratricopeptide (TPR) repeat protein